MHKLISIFYHNYTDKLIAIFPPINSTLQMTRLLVKSRAKASNIKQKRGQPAKANGTNKYAKNSQTSSFYLVFGLILIVCKWPFSHMTFLPACSYIFDFLPTFWCFLLGIDHEVFFINHLDLLIFFYQFFKRLEVFHWLTYQFFFIISR